MTSLERITEERTLEDGSKLTFEKYPLDPKAAALFKLTDVHYEIHIKIKRRDNWGGYERNFATSPRASWYTSEEVLRRLFYGVKNESEFFVASRITNKEINSKKDAQKLIDYLNQKGF